MCEIKTTIIKGTTVTASSESKATFIPSPVLSTSITASVESTFRVETSDASTTMASKAPQFSHSSAFTKKNPQASETSGTVGAASSSVAQVNDALSGKVKHLCGLVMAVVCIIFVI